MNTLVELQISPGQLESVVQKISELGITLAATHLDAEQDVIDKGIKPESVSINLKQYSRGHRWRVSFKIKGDHKEWMENFVYQKWSSPKYVEASISLML